ncbi:lipopolysaccharide export system permease protein [Palleronia aestuarii]|uniref:Lipopolysaccharide export system permease protein n=1 Tax=Palleronia aestuarii TaxID=568105 RepID=A0A2W7NAS7_9RHOB|nr:LPS export ABC transporter permease LptG [Palleronia aestuarii]PZX17505.1 lipopolysaccharide export system permease protein [Palleronia aestuarii]
MILHRYFARRFLTTFLIVAAIFLAILALIDLVEQVRRFSGDDVSFQGLIWLTFLSVPETFYRILPLIVIFATLTLFLNLARTSELVVTRAAGRSALSTLTAPVLVALLLGAASVAVMNPISAATSQQYELVANRASGGDTRALSLSREGLWLRQGTDGRQTVIRATRANLDGTVLYGVTFVGFGAGGGPSFRVEAEQARLRDGAWHLTGAKEWRFDSPNPELSAMNSDTITLPSSLSANQILDSFATPEAIPIWQLPHFIADLEQAGFSARRHRVWLQMELALPVLLVSMVLVGAAFTMRQTRVGRTGLMVLSALALGFALFFIRNFAQILGENGQIPILLAAWGPPAAAVLLPLGLLLHWEDG